MLTNHAGTACHGHTKGKQGIAAEIYDMTNPGHEWAEYRGRPTACSCSYLKSVSCPSRTKGFLLVALAVSSGSSSVRWASPITASTSARPWTGGNTGKQAGGGLQVNLAAATWLALLSAITWWRCTAAQLSNPGKNEYHTQQLSAAAAQSTQCPQHSREPHSGAT